MATANRVRHVWDGQNGLLSTIVVSIVIHERGGVGGSKASGAFILTDSYNPGRPNKDFEIKYHMKNSEPVPEAIIDKIFENTKTIIEYLIVEDLPNIDIITTGVANVLGSKGQFDDEVFNSATDYVKGLKFSIFDFELINKLLSSSEFIFFYDALHEVVGAYTHRIFVEELGL
ncbi:phosphoglucomutase 3 [Hibiscus trionum]|uniref:Phosphoglucomutase 3 n=1 Tax=Hibiscus trionum TaxID=183268 RepID=A0A9W7JA04_HIBTR|nr:phosphoglucomutase 3 [Hibiscus trionum]